MRAAPRKVPVKSYKQRDERAIRDRCVIKRAGAATHVALKRKGKERHKNNRKAGVIDRLQSLSLSAINCDIVGCMGEWAAAAYLNVPWNEDTTKPDTGYDLVLPDGRTVDVKTAQKIGYQLLIQPGKELKADIYVLAYAHPDKPTVYLAGWVTREQFLAGHHIATETRNRSRAMKPMQLNPMETLKP